MVSVAQARQPDAVAKNEPGKDQLEEQEAQALPGGS